MDDPIGTESASPDPVDALSDPAAAAGPRLDNRTKRSINGGTAAPIDEPVPSESHPPFGAASGTPAIDDYSLGADDPLSEEEVEYEDERARMFLAGGAYATVAIDRYDELPQIFGKVDAAASPRVALVAARGNRELQRALSMRRLQRHLDLTGKDLILVTRSRALRLRAREEGLPAVGSLRRVDFQSYGQGGLRLGWLTLRLPSIGVIVALLLLVAAVVGGAAVLFWYLPKADVTVFLPTTATEDSVDLLLDGQATTVDLATGAVPARRREVVVTRSIYRPATGVIQIPTSNAAVALRFTNRTSTPIQVPKGTVVVANNGVKFTVGGDIDLPRLNATADVVALAQQAGVVGNVPPNSITRVEGDLAGRVVVTNLAAGEKGTDRPEQVVSEADVEGVRAFAESILIDAARQELLLRLADTSTVFGASATVQVTDLKATPEVNIPGKYTDVKVTGRVSILTAEDADLRQVYVNHFRPMLLPDSMLLEEQFTTGTIRLGDPERTADRQTATVQVTATTAQFLDRQELQRRLAGQGKKGVEEIVRGMVDTAMPPLVKISPGWAPRLPRRADRITVTFAPAPPPAQ